MLAPDEMASRIPHWLRTLLVGCFVLLVTGAGLFAYRHFTAPKTMTLAAGSFDGDAVRLMSAIANLLTKTGQSKEALAAYQQYIFDELGAVAF